MGLLSLAIETISASSLFVKLGLLLIAIASVVYLLVSFFSFT